MTDAFSPPEQIIVDTVETIAAGRAATKEMQDIVANAIDLTQAVYAQLEAFYRWDTHHPNRHLNSARRYVILQIPRMRTLADDLKSKLEDIKDWRPSETAAEILKQIETDTKLLPSTVPQQQKLAQLMRVALYCRSNWVSLRDFLGYIKETWNSLSQHRGRMEKDLDEHALKYIRYQNGERDKYFESIHKSQLDMLDFLYNMDVSLEELSRMAHKHMARR